MRSRSGACRRVVLAGIGIAAMLQGCSPSGSPERHAAPGTVSAPRQGDGEAERAGAVASLVGRGWTLVALGDEAPGLVDGTEITLSFAAEGGISGSSGCNRYRSSVEVGPGDRLSVGLAASTRMACPEPVMDQEDRYLAALGGVTRYVVEGDRLTLTGDDVPALTYETSPDRP